MSAKVQTGMYPSETYHLPTRRRRFGMAFAVCTVLIILGATLYPFDFTAEGYTERLDSCLRQRFAAADGLADDIFTNVLLFLPFGFSFAYLARRRGLGFNKAFILVLFGGALLSILVEFLQLYLPFRYTSFIDIYANTAGAGAGFFFHALLGKKISQHLGGTVAQPNNRKALRWLTAAYLSYLAAALLITIPLFFSIRPFEWDKSFPLTLGNVHSGNRPWNGVIERMSLSKYAIDESMVTKTLEENKLSGLGKDELICDYNFLSGQTDRVRILPPLVAKGKTAAATTPLQLSKQRWYETEGAVHYLSSWLMVTREFTLLTRMRSSSTTQTGPARIISIDNNPYEVNFAITQLNDQLGIRFRSMTSGMAAYSPSFVIPGVFVDTKPHTLLVINDGLTLRVYIDQKEREYSVILGPGLALFNRFLPSNKTLDIASPIGKLSEILFIIVAFLPLSFFLAFIALGVRHRSLVLLVMVTVVGLSGPPLVFSKLFVYMTGREMPQEYLLTTVIIMLLGFAATWLVQSIKYGSQKREIFESFIPAPATIHQL